MPWVVLLGQREAEFMDRSLFIEFQFIVVGDLTKLRETLQACSLLLLLWLLRRRCALELLKIGVERNIGVLKVSYEWWDVTLRTKFCLYSNQEDKVTGQ